MTPVSIRDTYRQPEREQQRRELANEVEAFLAAGGQIRQLPNGAGAMNGSSLPPVFAAHLKEVQPRANRKSRNGHRGRS